MQRRKSTQAQIQKHTNTKRRSPRRGSHSASGRSPYLLRAFRAAAVKPLKLASARQHAAPETPISARLAPASCTASAYAAVAPGPPGPGRFTSSGLPGRRCPCHRERRDAGPPARAAAARLRIPPGAHSPAQRAAYRCSIAASWAREAPSRGMSMPPLPCMRPAPQHHCIASTAYSSTSRASV